MLRFAILGILFISIACGASFAGGDEDLDQDPPTVQVAIPHPDSVVPNDLPQWTSQAECEAAVIERSVHQNGQPLILGQASYLLQNHEGYGSTRFIPRVICRRLIRDQQLHSLDKVIIDEVRRLDVEQTLKNLESLFDFLNDRIDCVDSGRQYC